MPTNSDYKWKHGVGWSHLSGTHWVHDTCHPCAYFYAEEYCPQNVPAYAVASHGPCFWSRPVIFKTELSSRLLPMRTEPE